MHELAIAQGILQTIEASAATEHFQRVVQLRLQIGALAGVEPQALRFALTAVMGGTCLAGGEITIEETPGMARCLSCGVSVEIFSYIEPCPECGSFTLQATGGTELRVVDLLVANE